MNRLLCILAASVAVLISCGKQQEDKPLPKALILTVTVDGVAVISDGAVNGVSTSPQIVMEFSRDIAYDEVSMACLAYSGGALKGRVSGSILTLTPVEPLQPFTRYGLGVPAGSCFGVDLVEGFSFSFTTAYDTSDKFPRIGDDELLTLVQAQTFKYFWDYAHPVSGLARERLGSGDTVTSGGSGFGIMCLPVAVERGFITREAAVERMRKILAFLSSAERFHGAWPHWLDGNTGKALPFSTKDDGGDLVETSFMVQGLLTAGQYFDRADEADIRATIHELWEGVEWDWYTQGKNVLYWHWSPTYSWEMNMAIRGWNEALITYILAASSPTHPVSADVFKKGWGSFTFPVATDQPLFFAHYSFLGLDPRNLSDSNGSYWAQNVAHAQYNHDYCVRNPKHHAGYSAKSWGLTASDIPGGYSASAPSNDKGVIAPTAALSSMPYLPEQAMEALRTFYYMYGDKLWGEYGFHDAFSMDSRWFASSYIAIDQGPIVVMIENYRTQLLWNLFMQDQDVVAGLEKLGFTSK